MELSDPNAYRTICSVVLVDCGNQLAIYIYISPYYEDGFIAEFHHRVSKSTLWGHRLKAAALGAMAKANFRINKTHSFGPSLLPFTTLASPAYSLAGRDNTHSYQCSHFHIHLVPGPDVT